MMPGGTVWDEKDDNALISLEIEYRHLDWQEKWNTIVAELNTQAGNERTPRECSGRWSRIKARGCKESPAGPNSQIVSQTKRAAQPPAPAANKKATKGKKAMPTPTPPDSFEPPSSTEEPAPKQKTNAAKMAKVRAAKKRRGQQKKKKVEVEDEIDLQNDVVPQLAESSVVAGPSGQAVVEVADAIVAPSPQILFDQFANNNPAPSTSVQERRYRHHENILQTLVQFGQSLLAHKDS
ncbi:hypothetical protein MNV49_000107 [Pseudohyphozyma bogoriensis]|nr:hypothetical protein MNV49_000107 [Pseudohyphozyma bogoriensis]